eukprot:gene13753-29248_t
MRHVVSFVDRHESNGVEDTNKQILHHLRALVHDERLGKRWSHPTLLPLILFAINDEVNSETGVRPFDAKFGSDTGTYCRLPAITDSLELGQQVKDDVVRKRTASNPQVEDQNFYEPGNLIPYKYPMNKPKPSKLSSPFLCQYEVVRQTKNDVEARHLSMGNIRVFHVSEVKLCAGPREVARELSFTDTNQFDILEFRSYIGDPAKRTTCEFEVVFQDGSILWLPWSMNIFTTVQYETFCRARRELYPLLFTVAESRGRIKAIWSQAITMVQSRDTAYMDLRNINPYLYEGLHLDNKYQVVYVVVIIY